MFLQLHEQSVLLGRKPVGFTEHYFTEWDDDLGKQKIALFLLLSVNSTQVPGAELGREAFQLLQDHFLDDLTGDPYDRFEAALREINLMINQKERELELKFIPNMQVIVGVIQEDMLFLSQHGDSQGYLIRKRHVSSITEGLFDEKNKEDLFQNIASGSLEVGDSVLFTTGPLVQYVTPNDLSKIFSEQTLGDAVKELEELLVGDIEEQMALLSFEVLERTEPILLTEPVGEELDVPVVSVDEDLEETPRFQKTVRAKEKMKKSLERLRSWSERQEFRDFFTRLKRRNKKNLLIGIGVLALILVLGVFVLNLTLGQERQLEALQEKLDLAEENLIQAQTQGAFDKSAANELLDQAETLAVAVLDSGHMGGDASALLNEIEDQRRSLDNVQSIEDELTLLADFSSVLGGETLVGFEYYTDRVVAFTPTQAYEVFIDRIGDPKALASGEKVVAARYFEDYDTIVLLTLGGKVLEYTDGNTQFADSTDGSWRAGVDVATYSNKIYVLDPSGNQIWRYGRGTSGYGSAQSYFTGEVDLSEAVSLAVDGSVWVLKSTGDLEKYFGGEFVDYEIAKAPLSSMEGSTQVYTELEMNQVYVLDPADNRLFVLDKSGKNDNLTYNAQYVFEGLKGRLLDLYIDKDRNAIMLMTDQALYEWVF